MFEMKNFFFIGMLFFRTFISGVEYSIILPTALLYMKRFNVNSVFMGLVVSLYPFGAIISLPIFGYIYDKTKRIKELLIVLNLFQMVGNLLYGFNFSIWFPLVGRFISGLGDGSNSCVSGELTYLYTSSTRLKILSFLEIGRVFGFMLGPSLNFVIEKQNFRLKAWTLDKTTLPGIVMAFIWLLNELLTCCCVYNIRKEIEENLKSLQKDTQKISAATKTLEKLEEFNSNNCFESETESELTSSSRLLSDHFQELLLNNDQKKMKDYPQKTSFYEYWFKTTKAVFSIEFFVIFFVELLLWMIQTQFELLLPYITEFKYNWSPSAASLVYVGGGCIILIVFIVTIFLSKKIVIQEFYLVLLALILTSASTGLVILESVTRQLNSKVIIFIVISSLIFIAIPFNLVSTKSLIMKMFPAENQGIIQGIFSTSTRIAMIGGPITMSFVLENHQLYGIVSLVICFIAILSLSCLKNRIKNIIQINEKQT
ncbi:uncharacterized protein LOC101234579 isoform X1 [Hydra vulgaris]|uniref:uncharacterized protein LOC101234579 isoform X1 n=1 Tax=Hydra vulgaris TaxID=6087 RepID=UPI001F5E60E0|nr:SPX domain-containing membrane protein At4g11810 [Hydra vulgaris]